MIDIAKYNNFRNIVPYIAFLFFIHCCFITRVEAQSPPKILYLGPDHQGFWQRQREFMQEVAEDLNIDLQIRTANNRVEVKREIEQLIKQDKKPDYLIHNLQSLFGPKVFNQLEDHGIKSFLINAPIAQFEDKKIGRPRQIFKLWLGHMYPNEYETGRILANTLVDYAKPHFSPNQKQEILMLVVTGIGSSTAKLREQGLVSYVNTSANTKIRRTIKTKWGGSTDAVTNLLQYYPEVNVIWAAGDELAIEAIEAAKRVGKKPGRDIIIGGIDGIPESLDAISDGEMLVTLGGHYMEGGWALILLNDYHFGHDFKNETGLTIQLPMHVILAKDSTKYKLLYDKDVWLKIDFKKFSKQYNPSLKNYDFSLSKIFSMM